MLKSYIIRPFIVLLRTSIYQYPKSDCPDRREQLNWPIFYCCNTIGRSTNAHRKAIPVNSITFSIEFLLPLFIVVFIKSWIRGLILFTFKPFVLKMCRNRLTALQHFNMQSEFDFNRIIDCAP